ncbi:MAG: hypothetical protein II381_10255, partial [Victivallales bacterium]|nr:hypothetical protein [Victivallales bacterium]
IIVGHCIGMSLSAIPIVNHLPFLILYIWKNIFQANLNYFHQVKSVARGGTPPAIFDKSI